MAFTFVETFSGAAPHIVSTIANGALEKGDLCHGTSTGMAEVTNTTTNKGPLYVAIDDVADNATGQFVRCGPDTVFRTTAKAGSPVVSMTYGIAVGADMNILNATAEVDVMDARVEVIELLGTTEYKVIIHSGWDIVA